MTNTRKLVTALALVAGSILSGAGMAHATVQNLTVWGTPYGVSVDHTDVVRVGDTAGLSHSTWSDCGALTDTVWLGTRSDTGGVAVWGDLDGSGKLDTDDECALNHGAD